MTKEYSILQDAQKELNRAIWAGGLTYADEGKFDDLETRDKFVMKQVGETIKILEKFIAKTRPVQNGLRHKKKKIY
jgi:hypothetical protein